MYSEKTEIVDVVAVDNGYSLSKKAGDLFEAAKAGTVIRRHDVNETGNPDYKDYAYVGLSEVKLNGSGYSFTFASGDEFTASDADAYPSASSISDAIAGSGASEDEPLIGERTFTQVLGDPTSEGSGMMKTYYYELDDDIERYLEYAVDYAEDYQMYDPKQNCSYTIGGFTQDGGFFEKKDGKFYYGVFGAQIAGNRTFVMTETTFSPALINLYDPDSEDTSTYYPDGVYDSDNDVFTLDVSAAYERLKRGQNVWVRMWIQGRVFNDLVNSFYEEDDALTIATPNNELLFVNYNGESESDGE